MLSGYSSFEDVIEVEQRRRTRRSNDRSRIRDLSVENRVVKREMKELHYNMKYKFYLSYCIRYSWRIPPVLTSTAPIACTFMDIDVSTR